MSSETLIKKLVLDYLKNLKDRKTTPLKLAIGLSDSKILIWSEINDNDEATEDALLLAEAETNLLYRQYGFYINSTIIERSDNLPIPAHFQSIKA